MLERSKGQCRKEIRKRKDLPKNSTYSEKRGKPLRPGFFLASKPYGKGKKQKRMIKPEQRNEKGQERGEARQMKTGEKEQENFK